ncbi:MAG: tRNA 2-selenouridine(34) synthase MnmH [Betaproteobacteria bacterium]|nr:tRNA 2-selenouridine(34) synthase MnmH [Betaproteobacteria bacterium]
MVKQQGSEDAATRNDESDETRDTRPKAPQRSGPAPITVTVAQLSEFDEVIDVRSEGEYFDDHIPGALSCPVLDDAERALVGTIYKQSSSFDAKKIGAALVSANISRHLRERFQDRPREWRPLVYCWRGGGRSGSLANVLAQIGWRVGQLEGGYKSYRRAVMADLAQLPHQFSWRVVCGMTGTGKSRLLRALDAAGAQVLDLEALAAHRGSILGNLPGEPQPSQKMFDSLVWHELRRFDRSRPVLVEAESKKIGRLRVPEALIEAMWRSECLVLDAPIDVRVALLKSEYTHYIAEPQALIAQIECLTPLHGRETIDRWQALAREGKSDAFVEELLVRHYDPAYTRSTLKHYPALEHAPRFAMHDAGDAAFASLAAEVIEQLLARA